MSEIKILTDNIKNDFDSFLQLENNSRIFFAGKYGIGKTHFLKDFFNNYESQYDCIHLYPVNYQITNNDDIIDLLKYDIIVELLKKDPYIFETNSIVGIKDSSLLFLSWIKERVSINQGLTKIIDIGENISSLSPDLLINFLGKLGKPLKDILVIDKNFQEFKKEYKEGDKGKIEEYFKSQSDLFEPDYISNLLSEKIISRKADGKKMVIVLDDLDRMDPDHIFRILNVFSAYFEREEKNKFGFDSTIIVADYTNIKEIFTHKYGPNTDFSGYIDKFFTISPYYFDNKKAVINSVDEIVKQIRNDESNLNSAFNEGGYINLFLVYIFTKAINSEIMNLRELLKSTKFQLSELRKGSFYNNPFGDKDPFQQVFDIAIKIAISSFSSTDNFLNKIKLMKSIKIGSDDIIPFNKYNETMLKSLGVDFVDSNPKIWKEYKINKSSPTARISITNNLKDEDLFNDLLIDYVNSKKYLKSINHNY